MATFLTDNEMLSLSACLVFTIKAASGLHEILQLEYLSKSVQELSLASREGSIDHYCIDLIFLLENEIFTDLFDESSMFSFVNSDDGIFERRGIQSQVLDELV